jgi:hypothetical protein
MAGLTVIRQKMDPDKTKPTLNKWQILGQMPYQLLCFTLALFLGTAAGSLGTLPHNPAAKTAVTQVATVAGKGVTITGALYAADRSAEKAIASGAKGESPVQDPAA